MNITVTDALRAKIADALKATRARPMPQQVLRTRRFHDRYYARRIYIPDDFLVTVSFIKHDNGTVFRRLILRRAEKPYLQMQDDQVNCLMDLFGIERGKAYHCWAKQEDVGWVVHVVQTFEPLWATIH